jgi:hypothetical protein
MLVKKGTSLHPWFLSIFSLMMISSLIWYSVCCIFIPTFTEMCVFVCPGEILCHDFVYWGNAMRRWTVSWHFSRFNRTETGTVASTELVNNTFRVRSFVRVCFLCVCVCVCVCVVLCLRATVLASKHLGLFATPSARLVVLYTARDSLLCFLILFLLTKPYLRYHVHLLWVWSMIFSFI